MTEARFLALFGRRSEAHADAPGRVNLIGEHTDYNDGFVLPMAVPQRATVWIARRRDSAARFASVQIEGNPHEYTLGQERRSGTWLDYVQGITRVLSDAGHRVGGFDGLVSSDVPIGAGLASSAALEVAVLRALRAAYSLEFSDVELARLGQRAENDFVGARVGIMDQMAASLADERSALFIDAGSLAHERVALPTLVELVVIHSGVSHDHASGGYNERRRECEEACRALRIRSLRDLDESALAELERLPAPLGKRARHVVTENARVIRAVDAIRSGDIESLGALLYESHRSMRDDYAVSTPEIDFLVSRASEIDGVVGARLTGGGFGGSVVILARKGAAPEIARRLVADYARRYPQHSARVLVPQVGAREEAELTRR